MLELRGHTLVLSESKVTGLLGQCCTRQERHVLSDAAVTLQALHDNPQLLTLLQRGLASRQGEAEQTDEDDDAPGDINCRVN